MSSCEVAVGRETLNEQQWGSNRKTDIEWLGDDIAIQTFTFNTHPKTTTQPLNQRLFINYYSGFLVSWMCLYLQSWKVHDRNCLWQETAWKHSWTVPLHRNCTSKSDNTNTTWHWLSPLPIERVGIFLVVKINYFVYPQDWNNFPE